MWCSIYVSTEMITVKLISTSVIYHGYLFCVCGEVISDPFPQQISSTCYGTNYCHHAEH